MNVEVMDIEAYRRMFCYVGYDAQTKEWFIFEISRRKNELFQLVVHLRRNIDYFVGYNSLSYDSQVLQFIINNHQDWVDLEAQEIIDRIYTFSKRRIDDSNHDLKPPYFESMLWAKQIDPFKIHHFDNKNKRVSLKMLEFSLDMENIEEMPVPFDQDELNDEEIDLTIRYCKNDVWAAYLFYLLTIGETDHELYKGRNKIQDRLDIIQEYKFPQSCINWSDVKIGDEINLKDYCERKKIDRGAVYELKKKRRPTPSLTFGKCIPDYVEFTTPEFQSFIKRISKEKLKLSADDKKQFYLFSYGGTTYNIAKGGIHSNEKKRKIIPREGEVLKDADVGSQYPNAIYKRGLFPSHLGRAWNENFGANIKRRLDFKTKGKQDKRYKGLAEMLKLALNGGGFGKTNEKNSWQYDPAVHFACTIGNQFEILMLIEKLEVNGIHVVSANTDGIVCLYSRDKERLYTECCAWWEKKVGNTENGKLEYTEYEFMIQTSVNSYIAVKKDETDEKERIKKKGTTFLTDHEINKNKSRRIIALALEKYYVHNIPVEETILSHKNIFDFCIGVKSSKDYYFKVVDRVGGSKSYNSVVRYYPSLDGMTMLKIKREGSEATGPEISQAEAPEKNKNKKILVTVANHIDKNRPIETFRIDYQYFIDKFNKIIAGIQNPKAKKTIVIINKNQISLF